MDGYYGKRTWMGVRSERDLSGRLFRGRLLVGVLDRGNRAHHGSLSLGRCQPSCASKLLKEIGSRTWQPGSRG